MPVARNRPVHPGSHPRHPVRIVKRVLDRQLHVRRRELRQHRPVHKLHQGMNHRLGVNQHVDLLFRQGEEPPGFDDLQGLVHHGGRVDRDLGTHPPGGMLEGLLRGDLGQLFHRPVEKRSSAGREDQSLHLLRATALEDLKQPAVFAIDRQEPRAGFLGQTGNQFSGGHQGFLVGQGHGFARLHGFPRAAQRRQPGTDHFVRRRTRRSRAARRKGRGV